MFLNKTENQRNNISGIQIAKIRKSMKISQRELAERLEEAGLVIDKNAVQRIESGQRFVIDTELQIIARVLNISVSELLGLK